MVDLTNPSDANWIAEGRETPDVDVNAQVAAMEALRRTDIEQFRDARTGETLSPGRVRKRLNDTEWRPAGETVQPGADLPDPWHFIDSDGNRHSLTPLDE